MAEIMKPPALDESLNTTEVQSRNVADVLAQELQNLASSVKPSADEIDFDNTGTSLSSTNVEGAIKEVDTELSNKVKYNDGNGGTTVLQLRVHIATVTFANGVGVVTVPTEGKSLASFAFAVVRGVNSSLSVTYVTASGTNVTIGLTNTSYSGSQPCTILYFLY